MDISLNNQQKSLEFCLSILHYHVEGDLSHIYILGLLFLVDLENEVSESDQMLPVS